MKFHIDQQPYFILLKNDILTLDIPNLFSKYPAPL